MSLRPSRARDGPRQTDLGDEENAAAMDRRSPGRIIAGCFALCGFSTALFASLGAGATAETILLRAIVALVVCFLVGAAVGAAGERCIREGFEQYSRTHPVPTLPGIMGRADASAPSGAARSPTLGDASEARTNSGGVKS